MVPTGRRRDVVGIVAAWLCACGDPRIVAERVRDAGASDAGTEPLREARLIELDDLRAVGDRAAVVWGETYDDGSDGRFWATLSAASAAVTFESARLGGFADVARASVVPLADDARAGHVLAFQNHAVRGGWSVYWTAITPDAPAVDFAGVRSLAPVAGVERFQPQLARGPTMIAMALRQTNAVALALLDDQLALKSYVVLADELPRPVLAGCAVLPDAVFVLAKRDGLQLEYFSVDGRALGRLAEWPGTEGEIIASGGQLWVVRVEATDLVAQRYDGAPEIQAGITGRRMRQTMTIPVVRPRVAVLGEATATVFESPRPDGQHVDLVLWRGDDALPAIPLSPSGHSPRVVSLSAGFLVLWVDVVGPRRERLRWRVVAPPAF